MLGPSSAAASVDLQPRKLDVVLLQLGRSAGAGKLAQAPDLLSYGSWRRERGRDAYVSAAYQMRAA